MPVEVSDFFYQFCFTYDDASEYSTMAISVFSSGVYYKICPKIIGFCNIGVAKQLSTTKIKL